MIKNPPSTLYKYYEVKDFLPKILSGESLKFSCPFDFNDPFESRSCYQIDNSDEGKRFIHEKLKENYSNPSKRISEAQRIQRKFSDPRPIDEEPAYQELIRKIGVCCFSEVKDSILMWSHYANEHKGICIGFDTTKSLFRFAWQVNYQEEFPITKRPSESVDVLLDKTMLTKADCWSYEKEWRIVRRTLTEMERNHRLQNKRFSDEDIQLLINENGPGYYSFRKDAITEIYLGARIEKAQQEQVIRSVREANLNASIFEVHRNSSKYSLRFELIKVV